MKRRFAQEIKRNLFEAYLQPKRITVNLVSTTTSSSAAYPGGEAFDFSFSPSGHWTLALSSSRIYVLDTASSNISVQRELKVLRRPVAATILDDGSTLVVLSSDHQVNVYDLADQKTKHVRSISLDNSPHAIALTPKGEVLAAAFQGGVELHSLAPNASELDRRTVKCDRVDALTFSSDGTILLGTTRSSRNPNTVILTAPYYTEDNQELPESDQISHIWTSQIIFPNSSRDCSNTALLSNRSDGDANWTFTFDRVFESFRAVRTDDLRNGTTYFTGPKRPRRPESVQPKKTLTPCTLPAPSHCGDLVAAGFLGKDIWLYGVPEGLDIPTISQTDDPNSNSSGPSTPASAPRSPATSYTRGEAAELKALPKWQVLVDKYRNVFAKGRRVTEIPGATALCWVDQHQQYNSYSVRERLIVAAPGGISVDSELDQNGLASVDGGRLIILDFDLMPENGEACEVTYEVGNAVPELLEEERVDLDTEVELARRRTRKEARPVSTVVDALASTSSIPPLPPTANAIANMNAASRPEPATQPALGVNRESIAPSESPGLSLEEASQVFDRPYSHTQPRSRTSLYRSATAVAANRERNPPRIVNEATVVYRRPDGRGELPHESDADNWVPPPPPYAPKADIPLPEHLQRSIMPRPAEVVPRPRSARERPRRASTMYENNSSRRISSLPQRPSQQRISQQVPISARSVSETLDQLSGPVSPISSHGFSFGDEGSEPSSISRRSTASSRRPVSAYVGRFTHSLRRSSNPRLRSPTSESPDGIPPIPQFPGSHNQTVSLPPSPTRHTRPTSSITSIAPNLQHRLSQPLAPPPTSISTPHQPADLSDISSMPSAQQMTNLSNRYRTPPPTQSGRRSSPNLNTSGDRIPAPPPGALGAAGGRTSPIPQTSPALHAPARTLSSLGSQAAQSSPALLRPAARRLDTIESVASSFASHSRSRSRGLRSAGSGSVGGVARRSHSVGPALRLDRVSTAEQTGKGRGFFGGKKRRGREHGDGKEKSGKCVVM